MRKPLLAAATALALTGSLRADASLQQQLDDLKAQVDTIKQTYERTEPAEVVKQVTEYVSPSGEIFAEPQKDGVSPTDGSKLEERVTYRKLKFSRRESVAEKIDAAVGSAVNGHVIAGLELVGSYLNTVGNGDFVDANGQTHNANKGRLEGGKVDVLFSGKPMRNTIAFVDLDAANGTAVLSEAWVAVSGPRNIVSLQAGVIDLTSIFDGNAVANDETTEFLSPGFVNSPLLGNPANALGAVLRGLYGRWDAGVGAQKTEASLDDVTDDVYVIGELGFRYHLLGDHHVRVWGRQQPRSATGESNIPDQALGVSTDHRMTSRLTAFGRYAKNSYVEDAAGVALNTYDWAASTGFELGNFNPKNLKERLGIAYGRTQKQDGSSEDVAEYYHRIPLTPNFAFSLHYQAAFSRIPAGLGLDALPPTHTVGLRIKATY